MAAEIPHSANHNTTYSGGLDYHPVFSGPEYSPSDFSDASLNGWDFDIDPTTPPSHLLSGINQHGGFTLPLDSDLGINDQYGSNLHPNAGSGLDQLDVSLSDQFDQSWLSSLLLNGDTSDADGAEGLECSPELQKWMNDLGSLLMEGNGVQSDNTRFGAVEIPQKRKNTGGRPMKQITKEDLLNCEGRTLEAVKDELRVSVCTLKRRLEDLTGYKKWTDFRRSKSFPPHIFGLQRGKNTIRSSFNSRTRTVAKAYEG